MGNIITLSGDYGYDSYKFSEKGLDVDMIDASAASWTVANGSDGGSTLNLYPFAVVYSDPGLILHSGTINGEVSLTADWEDAYINSAGMRIGNSPGVIVRDWRIDRPWDGIRIAGESSDFLINKVWISNSRDDAIENDDMNGGTISNSLFDGVSSGISLGDGNSPDGSDNVVTVDGVLLRNKSFLNEGKLTHGSPIKMEKSSPDITPSLRIHNTVFAIEDVDHNGQTRLQKAWDKTIESSDNHFLNLSDTPFPDDYPLPGEGWTILEGQAARDYWDEARLAWIETHGDTSLENTPIVFNESADIDLSANIVAEDAAAGTAVGITVLATDPDKDDVVTYSIDDRRFSVDANGVVSRSDSGGLDSELEAFISLAVTATSADGSSLTQDFSLNVSTESTAPEPTSQVTEIRILASTDDVEERSNGSVNFTSSDLELVDDGSSRPNQTVGLRFDGLDIPQGAVITAAHVQFQVDEEDSGFSTLLIRGEGADSAAAFADTSFDVSSRKLTDAAVQWAPSDWMSVGEAGAKQQTADISSILQEIISRGGWAAENALALVITGDGQRTAESFDGDESAAPLLHVEWKMPDIVNTPIVFNESADIDLSANIVAEDAAAGTAVGITVLATDPDKDDVVTYSIDDRRFSVDANGVVSRSDSGGLDSELEAFISLAVTATSADGSSLTQDFSLNVSTESTAPEPTSQVTEIRILASTDDVEERSNGSVNFTSSDLELVDDGSSRPNQTVGLRFDGLDIPQGAVITAAHVQFQVDEEDSGFSTLLIRGEGADSAAAFADTSFDVSSRKLTDAAVQWAPSDWMSVGEAGAKQQTADISSILQEIISRGGWAAENALALVITGDGQRTAESFDGDESAAPLLHVEWKMPSGETSHPAVDQDTTPPNVSLDSALEGTSVFGTVSLKVDATDDVAVQDVQFRIDSESIGDPNDSAPYTYQLDTTKFSDGTAALSAVVTDTSGNRAVSSPLTIKIDNTPNVPPPPPPPPPSSSGTIRVPQDYKTLQEAVNAAGDGDVVLVGTGTYNGGIVVSNKSITIASLYSTTNDPDLIDSTVISGGSPAIYVDESAPNTIVQGFHFVGGSKSVQFFGEGGQALDNFFDIDYSGNANREFLVERNLIQGNRDAGLGLMDEGETAEDFRAASMPERIYIINNTFDDNSAGISGGDNLISLNNIVSNSSALGLKNVDGSSIVADTLFFKNARDHVGSNVDLATVTTADPLYTGAFGLEPASPAIDAGGAYYFHNGETVLDIPDSEYSGSSVDLGWFEF